MGIARNPNQWRPRFPPSPNAGGLQRGNRMNCPDCGNRIDSRVGYCVLCRSTSNLPESEGFLEGGSLLSGPPAQSTGALATPQTTPSAITSEPNLRADPHAIESRYRILGLLGRGGMGVVYKVFDRVMDRTVALKLLPGNRGSGPNAPPVEAEHLRQERVRLMKYEFLKMASFNHPNVARVYDFGFTRDGGYYFTMEFIEGEDLLTATSGMGYMEILVLVVDICRALEYIHSRGVVHHDIKPSNIMVLSSTDLSDLSFERVAQLDSVDQPPRIKLIDFGIMREISHSGGKKVRGTPRFMAPEAFRGEGDQRTDLYALGVTLYKVICGIYPFVGETLSELIALHRRRHPRPPSSLKPDLPPVWEELILKLLAKDPADRFGSANQVIRFINHRLGTNFRIETRRTSEGYVQSGKFVGRGAELKLLREGWRAIGSRPNETAQVLLIGGEAGVGKSRLLKEFKLDVQMSEGLIFVASCHPYQSIPYEAIATLLDQLLSHAAEHAPSLIRKYASVLGKLVKVPHLPQAVVPSLAEHAEERIRLFTRVAEFLREVSRHPEGEDAPSRERSPLVLVIEDLHLADPSTLDFIHALGQMLRGANVMLILTLRTDEPSPALELFDRVGNDPELQHWRKITLSRLKRGDVARLVETMFPRPDHLTTFIDRLMIETEGNVFFIEEIMKSLIEEGSIVREDRGWKLAEAGERIRLPSSIEGLIQRRFLLLDGTSRKLLQYAAVAAMACDPDLLRQFSGLDDHLVYEKLTDLTLRNRFLSEQRSPEGSRYDFVHGKFREVIYAGIDPGERRAIHRRIGVVLESLYPPREIAGQLAYHFLKGQEVEKAFEYSVLAGEIARERYNYDVAIAHYTNALTLPVDAPGRKCELYLYRAEALKIGGHYDAALEDYHKVLHGLIPMPEESVQESTERKGFILWDMSDIHRIQGRLELAMKCGMKALKLFSFLKHWQGMARSLNLIGRIHLSRHELSRAREVFQEALQLCFKYNDEAGVADALNNIGKIYHRWGDARAFDHFSRACAIRERMGDLYGMADALNNIGLAYYEAGDHERALGHLTRALEIRRSIGNRYGEAATLNNIGSVYFAKGWFRKSRKCFAESLELKRTFGNRYAIASALNNIGMCLLPLCHFDEARESFSEAIELARGIKDQRMEARLLHNFGLIERASGAYWAAMRFFRKAVQLCEQVGFREGRLHSLAEIGDLYRILGCGQEARGYLSRGLALAEEGKNADVRCRVLVALGLLALREGRMEEAADRLDMALRLAQRSGNLQLLLQSLEAQCRRWCRLSDAERYHETAKRLFREAKSVGYRTYFLQASLHLARLEAPRNFARAEHRLLRIGAISRRLGLFPILWRIEAMMGVLYLRHKKHVPERDLRAAGQKKLRQAEQILDGIAEKLPDPALREKFRATIELRRILEEPI
ncbi:MAG: tetratricopeptide repeat protein [Deltaproteobacteria bacterium]|nr:MAG: tetratricopeptide repeat protein [Deltaproteobacteria bacterium]